MENDSREKTPGKSVVDQVADGIISRIIDGSLHPGDKLPTEMELCRQFGAGRNSVREAVKKLQAYGILYIKRADGTFVSESYNQKMLDPMLYSIILQKNSWRDFVELRSVIDIGTLNVVIQREDIASFLPDLYWTFGELSAELHSVHPLRGPSAGAGRPLSHPNCRGRPKSDVGNHHRIHHPLNAAQSVRNHPPGAGTGRCGPFCGTSPAAAGRD